MPAPRAADSPEEAATASFPIERCGRSLPCRQSWQDLESLKDESDVRFCVLCQRAVFLCRSTAELDRTAALGRCAAVVQMDDVDLPHQPDRDEAAA